MSDIEALTAALNAGLDADEAAAKRNLGEAGLGDTEEYGPSYPDYQTYSDEATGAADDYIRRFRPFRMLREVAAKRDLIAAALAQPHEYIDGDAFYSCSQAIDPHADPGEDGPGSGCLNEARAGQPCDCGRDLRVERLLRILAGIYEEAPHGH